jgi:hypothetical protein
MHSEVSAALPAQGADADSLAVVEVSHLSVSNL